MGFGMGSRSYYASFGGWVFQFEDKRTRDLLVKGGRAISAKEADGVSYIGRCGIPRLCSVYPKPKKLKK